MTTTTPDLRQLTRGTQAAEVPRPGSRWKTRVLLPAAIGAATLGLFGYAARGVFWPAVDVWVVPVVAAPEGTASGEHGGMASVAAGGQIQAPGWIEPAPYPLLVPALAEGVIREVLVLEGERVEMGQIVARLIDDDARLGLARSEAELREQRAAADRARADADAAEAREKEIRIDLDRKGPLVESGAVSDGLVAALRARLDAAKLETAAARSAVTVAEASVARREVGVREAALHLERMEVRAPRAGVVLALLVEPGQRVSMSAREGGGGAMSGGVARLYDPGSLQVRVDVPLADASKVGVGSRAEIVTEAVPGRTFHGAVTRVMHEANIQRNTVQVKVSVDDPEAALKPEMLARVRLAAPAGGQAGSAARDGGNDARAGGRLLVLASALHDARDGRAWVWLVDQSQGAHALAARREITSSGDASDGYVLVAAGLSAGDRVIVDAPSGLRPGARVRVMGERREKKAD